MTWDEDPKRFDESRAMFCNALPCNPRPFARALADRLCDGSVRIEDDEAKRILWMLNAMAFGQLATISLFDEYGRLAAALYPPQTATVAA